VTDVVFLEEFFQRGITLGVVNNHILRINIHIHGHGNRNLPEAFRVEPVAGINPFELLKIIRDWFVP
jgi:hypothetical protein